MAGMSAKVIVTRGPHGELLVTTDITCANPTKCDKAREAVLRVAGALEGEVVQDVAKTAARLQTADTAAATADAGVEDQISAVVHNQAHVHVAE